MTEYLICGGQLITSSGALPNTGLLISRGKIAAPGATGLSGVYMKQCCATGRADRMSKPPETGRTPEKKNCCTGEQCTRDCVEIDASDLLIAPGFIDLHVHGGWGCDALDGTANSMNKIAAFHARGGTTSFLATVAPAPREELRHILSAISSLTMGITGGAQLIGIHMEGPYINPCRAGAINPDYIRDVDPGEMYDFLLASEGSLRMVTVAPELPGCQGLIEMLCREGVIVSAGHSDADYETSLASFRAGIRHAVHLFNASAPLHHREPGLVGAVLAEKEITAEIIADGLHLHPAMLKLLLSIKGNRGLTLGSDAVSAAGKADGEYLFNGRKVFLKKGRITLPGGQMAGSTLTMIEAVRNMVRYTGIPLHQAVRMASLNPARLLGKERVKGTLSPGMDADLVLLDSDLKVRLTMVRGQIVYSDIPDLTEN